MKNFKFPIIKKNKGLDRLLSRPLLLNYFIVFTYEEGDNYGFADTPKTEDLQLSTNTPYLEVNNPYQGNCINSYAPTLLNSPFSLPIDMN